ncbi:MAG: glycosyltransferase family 2 protein [Bdellovibrionota bacterium]
MKVQRPLHYGCLILTKNEEETIPQVLGEIRERFGALGLETPTLILSDDSTDRTPELAASQGAQVVTAGNRGLGRAYVRGLEKCRELALERIFVLDGDGQANLEEIPAFIAAMEATGADLVTGSRFLDPRAISYDYPRINRIGTRLLSTYLSWMTGQRFTDSHGGLRLMTGTLAEKQKIYGHHTYVQESIVDAVQQGFQVVEISSRWRERRHGMSRVTASPFRYARKTLPYLLFRAAEAMLRTK